MSQESLTQFCQKVFSDDELQAPLRELTDRLEFAALAVQIGHQEGLEFTVEEVEERLTQGRRAWFERWI
jgi:hypothetical protein